MHLNKILNTALYAKGFKSLSNSKGLVIYSTISVILKNTLKNSFYSAIRAQFGQCIVLQSPLLIPTQVLKNSGHLEVFKEDTEGGIFYNEKLACRPETCQTIFKYYTQYIKQDGQEVNIFQIGASVRLEKTTKGGLNRLTEFTQMQFESFNPAYPFELCISVCFDWLKNIGLNVRIFEKPLIELPHYAKRTVDIEYNDGEKWVELASINDRGTHDVGKNTTIYEISTGLDRIFYALSITPCKFTRLTPIEITSKPTSINQLKYSPDINLNFFKIHGIPYKITEIV